MHAIDEQQIGPTVVIIIDDGAPAALDFRKIHLSERSVAMSPRDARRRRDSVNVMPKVANGGRGVGAMHRQRSVIVFSGAGINR